MNTSLKIGVIGCGQQAPKHIGGLVAAAGPSGVEIVVADVAPEAAKRLAAELPALTTAVSLDALFEDPMINGVVLAVPTPAHAPLIRKAIAAGKDYLVEKPLCEDYEEARGLDAATKAAGLIGIVGCIYRYVPPFMEAAKALEGARETSEAAALGRVVAATFRIGGRGSRQPWKHMKATGGGAINEMLVHMLDLAIWYFGPPVETELLVSKVLRPTRLIQGKSYEVDAEDFVVMRMVSASGVEILLQADMVTPSFAQSFEVQGENGSLIASITPNVTSKLYVAEPRGGFDAGWKDISGSGDFYVEQARAFLNGIRTRRAPPEGALSDAVSLMQVVDQMRAGS